MRSKVCSTEKRHISLSHTVDPPRGFQRWEWNDGEGSGSGNLYNGSAPIWKTKQKQTRGAWACRRAGAQPRSPSRRTPSTVVTTRGGAARPGTLRCTCAHRYLSRGPIWGGETAKDVWAYFSNILGSEHVFPKHFPSEYLNPCVFRGKLDPHVSDSFTLNLSNCCFVRATWCPRSFMRVCFFFLNLIWNRMLLMLARRTKCRRMSVWSWPGDPTGEWRRGREEGLRRTSVWQDTRNIHL